jgi:hypothetical protein
MPAKSAGPTGRQAPDFLPLAFRNNIILMTLDEVYEMKFKSIRPTKIRVAMMATLAMLLLMTAIVLAQSGGDFSLSQWTINNGGGTSNGGSFAVSATLGQPDAGALMSGGQFGLQGGFLPSDPSGANPPKGGNDIYLPLIVKK